MGYLSIQINFMNCVFKVVANNFSFCANFTVHMNKSANIYFYRGGELTEKKYVYRGPHMNMSYIID